MKTRGRHRAAKREHKANLRRARVRVHLVDKGDLAAALRREMGMAPVIGADQLELAIAGVDSTGFSSASIQRAIARSDAASAGVDERFGADARADVDAGARRGGKP